MNDPVYNELRELAWRRPLTEAELAKVRKHLAEHPEDAVDWQAEAGLSRLLERLPEAPPVASNFTAQVMQAIQRETAARNRARVSSSIFGWFSRNWIPKVAVGAVAAVIAVVSVHQHQSNARATMAVNVAGLADAVSASGPDVIQNFDSINRLSDSPPKADTELLALMK